MPFNTKDRNSKHVTFIIKEDENSNKFNVDIEHDGKDEDELTKLMLIVGDIVYQWLDKH